MVRDECQIFVGSVQRELAAERRAVRDFIRKDALFREYFEVFLFEDLPASDRAPDGLYQEQVSRSAIYLGLFSNDYGSEDADGISPTEREFDAATEAQANIQIGMHSFLPIASNNSGSVVQTDPVVIVDTAGQTDAEVLVRVQIPRLAKVEEQYPVSIADAGQTHEVTIPIGQSYAYTPAFTPPEGVNLYDSGVVIEKISGS